MTVSYDVYFELISQSFILSFLRGLYSLFRITQRPYNGEVSLCQFKSFRAARICWQGLQQLQMWLLVRGKSRLLWRKILQYLLWRECGPRYPEMRYFMFTYVKSCALSDAI